MKAIRIHGRGRLEDVKYEDVPAPELGAGQALVRVAAGALIYDELNWAETYATVEGAPRSLPIPGRDLCGVIEQVNDDGTDLATGDAVFGMLGYGRDGAAAEYAIALPGELAPKPLSLDDVHAAAVPLSALTAWQALFDHGALSSGQHVLVHGAAGGVGTYAVQLARWAGAHVTATASPRNTEFVRDLGADAVLDYTTTRFDDVVHDADVVFDPVGGDTLASSWNVVKNGGHIVSIVTPPPAPPYPRATVHFAYFIVEPNVAELRRIGELIDAGHIRSIVDSSYPLAEFRQAYERAKNGHPRGKVVLTVP